MSKFGRTVSKATGVIAKIPMEPVLSLLRRGIEWIRERKPLRLARRKRRQANKNLRRSNDQG